MVAEGPRGPPGAGMLLPRLGTPAALAGQSRGITGASFRGFWCSRSILGARKGGKVIPRPPSSSGTTRPDKEQGEGAGTWGMMPWELPAAVPSPEAGPTHTRERTRARARARALPWLSSSF